MKEMEVQSINEMLSIHQFDPNKIEDRIDLQNLLDALGTQISVEVLKLVYSQWLVATPGDKRR